MGRRNKELRPVLNNSFMTLPDGKPLFWVARLKSLRQVGHVPGPDFFPELLSEPAFQSVRHFFFGSTPGTLDLLLNNLKQKYPNILITGSLSPPFRMLSDEEDDSIIDTINRAQPDIIWVGLGAPKQEIWMAKHWQQLKPAILMGIGAAFDFHAGTIRRAPTVLSRIGLEWLHRLLSEPGRLWKRYLITNSLFLYYLTVDWLRGAKP